ncbi:hypothetical protein DY000_02023707 [Brassica cretica]|uniref:Uncharacterized protein n=1 Tax=Brassica cretica TaxID=69181 RepID=A0ABQ7E4M2_BRACR|nr:hypothetical protein DY000_02023707 [Brassica cretica]
MACVMNFGWSRVVGHGVAGHGWEGVAGEVLFSCFSHFTTIKATTSFNKLEQTSFLQQTSEPSIFCNNTLQQPSFSSWCSNNKLQASNQSFKPKLQASSFKLQASSFKLQASNQTNKLQASFLKVSR